jgi:triosephosphate isomerase (TIM)
MKYIIANWKCNKTTAEVKTWLSTFAPFYKKFNTAQIEVILCPTFIHLSLIRAALPELKLGTQTISPYPMGAYTGAVAASIAKEYADYAIVGHVERRQFFNETDQMVTNQAVQALENSMTPILAVNDMNWSTQLGQLSDEQLKKALVMYEPPEAISTNGQGNAASVEKVTSAIQMIKTSYQVKGVLYGGSVSAENVREYLSAELIDGVVPGNASLDVQKFMTLLQSIL